MSVTIAKSLAIEVHSPLGRQVEAEPGDVSTSLMLWGLFRTFRGRILTTYALFNLENLLLLAQPYCLGLAITGLLAGSPRGLMLLAAQHFGWAAIGSARRVFDTRIFTGIYSDLAARVVLSQRARAVEVSSIAARSALSRELVDFFERDVPIMVLAVYSMIGALIMIGLYDPTLLAPCLVLAGPAGVLNWSYGRVTTRLNARLNDELEREISVIGRGQGAEVHGHFASLSAWRIKLSDIQAVNFALMEVFVLMLMVVVLLRSCYEAACEIGRVVAVFRYVLMFVMGLDSVPLLVQQLGRLRDIGLRLHTT